MWAGVGSDQFDGLDGKKDCRVGRGGELEGPQLICKTRRPHRFNKFSSTSSRSKDLRPNPCTLEVWVLFCFLAHVPLCHPFVASFFLHFPSPCFSLSNTDNIIRGAPMSFPFCQTLTLDKIQRHHRWVHLRFTVHARDDSTEVLLLLLHVPLSRYQIQPAMHFKGTLRDMIAL